MSIREIRTQVLTGLTLVLMLAAAWHPGHAPAAVKKATFEVKFEGDWGALWYVRLADGEPHAVCLAGDGAEGGVDVKASTAGKRTVRSRLIFDARQGHAFGRVPIQVTERRTFMMGLAVKGCDEDYAESAGLLDCDAASAQWGQGGGPPAWLDIAAGRGVVKVTVTPEQRVEHINRTWRFCPFWVHRAARIDGIAKLSARKLLSGKPQTAKGRTRHDHPGGEGEHAQEGLSEWKMTIRYVKPRKK